MRLCDGVMLVEPGRSGREQSVRVALKVWRYAARRSGPMRADCEAKRSEPTRGNTVPGGLAKFPRQIGEVPPAARRGPPRQLDEVPPAGRRGPAGGCPAKCVSGVGSERGERERLRTIRPRLVARRGTSESRRPRMATRRSEAGHVWQRGEANRIETIRIEPRFGRNETIRGHVWHEAQRYGPRLACVGVLFLLWALVPALLVPRDGEHTKDRDRRSTTSVNGP